MKRWTTATCLAALACVAFAASGAAAGAPAPRQCRSANLHLLVGDAGAAAGTSWSSLIFINTGPACSLRGYPGVSALTIPGGRQVGAPAVRELAQPGLGGSRVATIVLARNGTASSVLRQGTALNFPAASCRPRTVEVLRVFPPGETHPVYAGYRQKECAIGRAVIGITPVAAGPGPLLAGVP
ncbi:MAG: hypothetical protein QOC86_1933 [Gaiellales bacterium]|nr:hypothetical protein [Gaiellales bacterium]